MVRAGVRGCAQKSPPGFGCRLGPAPRPVAALVSPRLTPEDHPGGGTQSGSKRPLPLRQRQKVQKVLRCLTPKCHRAMPTVADAKPYLHPPFCCSPGPQIGFRGAAIIGPKTYAKESTRPCTESRETLLLCRRRPSRFRGSCRIRSVSARRLPILPRRHKRLAKQAPSDNLRGRFGTLGEFNLHGPPLTLRVLHVAKGQESKTARPAIGPFADAECGTGRFGSATPGS